MNENENIWRSLRQKGLIKILAPMEDVTDTVFRRAVMAFGRPDLMFTEFTNCEGLMSDGRDKIKHRLQHEIEEKPIIAQVWGLTPQDYYDSAKYINSLGFDGIDINMGCPVKKIIQKGACSALINNPTLADEIIKATIEGAGNMPVSVKTRIGFKEIETDKWIGFLLENSKDNYILSAITVHGRTVKEESKVPNHFDQIGLCGQLRNEIQKNIPKEKQTLIIANGDIDSTQFGDQICQNYQLDGYMVGRGVFKNPWLFNEQINLETINKFDRLNALKLHLNLWKETWGNDKNPQIMKRFVKIYINGFDGANSIRSQIMDAPSLEKISQILNQQISILS
jgi:tRNA-dihydrouridine synthase